MRKKYSAVTNKREKKKLVVIVLENKFKVSGLAEVCEVEGREIRRRKVEVSV